jgi:hypothetical protein
MSKRVFLHVGTPTPGTTYVQAVLWQNADALKRDGLLLPARFAVHYAAAKGVTTRTHRQRELDVDVEQAWGKLARQAKRWEHDALISHELLAPATRDQARAAKRRLGKDTEIHLIVTARALHLQLATAWQEQVKSGMSLPFRLFVNRVRDREARGEWFWEVQDTIDILDRWGPRASPAHVHIVTVPAGVGAPDTTPHGAVAEAGQLGRLATVWSRFSSVLGVDPRAYDSEVPRKPGSLGVVESELLRRVHAMRDGRFTDTQRHYWTRRILAGELLARRAGAPILLPDDARPWLEDRSTQIIDTIRARGYHVVGDVGELAWGDPPAGGRAVESVTPEELAEATRWTISRLQEELVERQPVNPPPPVGPDDGVPGVLELLEHIRAADTGEMPRAPILRRLSAVDRLRKTITSAVRRG